ncbi:hypothetical protein [Halorussus caseinilyticus]|uniref:DUF2892 domain-containing protein n=1 Tax=Halorussus caseinilyticus TaxID=3034025 RepID=A0ABD5WKF4_9EURY|nr:hypothetical protein [Halorussus sp. DT72]
MSSSDAVTETLDEGSNGVADRAGSLAETVGPKLARHAESGNLAAASGVVSLVRAGRTFLKGERKRGALQALGGLFWIGVALAQRRSGGAGERRRESDLAEVADTPPDVDPRDVTGSADVGDATEDDRTEAATGTVAADGADAESDRADAADSEVDDETAAEDDPADADEPTTAESAE